MKILLCPRIYKYKSPHSIGRETFEAIYELLNEKKFNYDNTDGIHSYWHNSIKEKGKFATRQQGGDFVKKLRVLITFVNKTMHQLFLQNRQKCGLKIIRVPQLIGLEIVRN